MLQRVLRAPGLAGLGLVALLAAVGCSAGSDDEGTTSQGGAGAGGSTGTFGEGGSTGSFGGGSQGQGGGCAGVSQTAQKVPLDMYLMLDQSGSMSDPPSGGSGTKWDAVVSAITSFVNQPQSNGIGVGIQYFPLESGVMCPVVPVQCTNDSQCQTGCGPCEFPPGFPFGICSGVGNADSCEVTDYSTPDVGMGSLPQNAGAIVTSMGNHGPTGGTPTRPALEGAVDYATSHALANPGHAVIVVLATDGDPNSCDSDLAGINAIAAAGAAATPKILTFVIGVGGSVGALNGIAAAGGTGSAFMIDTNPNVQQAFLDALNDIQGAALPCSYLIPEPPPGEMLDYGAVNVVYTPGGGGPEQTIPQASDPGNCPPGGLAWHYDDPQSPTQIMLCPDTCGTLSADTGGSVDIVLGCATIVQ